MTMKKANSKIMRVTNLANCVTVTEFETALTPPSKAKQESREKRNCQAKK